MGWEQLCAFLRANSREPVICSYSVCEQFPGLHVLTEFSRKVETTAEEWKDFDEQRQWTLAFGALRQRRDTRLSAETLYRRFSSDDGSKYDIFDVLRRLHRFAAEAKSASVQPRYEAGLR